MAPVVGQAFGSLFPWSLPGILSTGGLAYQELVATGCPYNVGPPGGEGVFGVASPAEYRTLNADPLRGYPESLWRHVFNVP